MADFSAIKALIDEKIYDNQSQAITGEALNESLQGMVDVVNQLKGDKIPIVESVYVPQGGMLPNVYYILTSQGASGYNTYYTFADAEDEDINNVWMFQFTYGEGTVVWDEKILAWLNGSTPDLSRGHTYEVFMSNGFAVIGDFTNAEL